MKIQIFAVLSGIIVLFSFQNCQKAPHPDEISSVSPDVKSANSKIDLRNEKISQIDISVQENETVVRGTKTYQLMVNKVLQIDLSTGVFQVVSDLGGAPVKYCLPDDLTNELVSILKSSQICAGSAAAVPVGQVCAQVLKPAYAQLLTDVEQFDLGYSSDSCGNNSVDLCGEQATMLKAYIAALKPKYKTFSCPL